VLSPNLWDNNPQERRNTLDVLLITPVVWLLVLMIGFHAMFGLLWGAFQSVFRVLSEDKPKEDEKID